MGGEDRGPSPQLFPQKVDSASHRINHYLVDNLLPLRKIIKYVIENNNLIKPKWGILFNFHDVLVVYTMLAQVVETVGSAKRVINRYPCWSNAIDFPNNDGKWVIL